MRYASRLVEDETAQSLVSQAAQASADAYRRARPQAAREAARDKKVRRRVAEAAGAVRQLRIVVSEPQRRPTRALRATAVALLAGGIGVLVFGTQLRAWLARTIGNRQTETLTETRSELGET